MIGHGASSASKFVLAISAQDINTIRHSTPKGSLGAGHQCSECKRTTSHKLHCFCAHSPGNSAPHPSSGLAPWGAGVPVHGQSCAVGIYIDSRGRLPALEHNLHSPGPGIVTSATSATTRYHVSLDKPLTVSYTMRLGVGKEPGAGARSQKPEASSQKPEAKKGKKWWRIKYGPLWCTTASPLPDLHLARGVSFLVRELWLVRDRAADSG